MSTPQAPDATASPPTTLRDVLYVDEKQVDTLSSQLVDSPEPSSDRNASESNGAPTSGQPTSSNEDMDRRGEASQVRYHRRYRRVEEELADAIVDPADLDPDTIRNQLEPGRFIRVTGATFLEDYEMLSEIFEQWIDIADALAAARVFEQYGFSGERELQRLRSEIKKLIEKTEDASKESTLRSQLETLPPDFDTVFGKVAGEMGMHDQEEWIEQHLSLFNNLFHGSLSAFSLTRDEDEGVSFNAPINSTHLRVEPDRLRALYNGTRLGQWTLVGRVTSVPQYSDDPGVEDIEAGGGSEHMRDNFRGMLGPVQEVYESIYESESVAEIVLRPIALYQETTIKQS